MDTLSENPYHKLRIRDISYDEELFISSSRPRSQLHLFSYGESVFRPGYRNPLSSMGWVLQILTEGTLLFITPDGKFRLKPGDIFLMRPGSRYAMRVSSRSGIRKRFLGIANGAVMNAIASSGIIGKNDVFHPREFSVFSRIFDDIKTEIMQSRQPSLSRISVLLYGLFEELNEQISGIFPSAVFDDKNGIFAVLSSRLNRKYTLASMASEINVSKRTLNRIFKVKCGCSPMEFMIRARMEYARHLLLMNKLLIQDIAQECGYSSHSLFIREFRKRFRMTPNQFRKNN